jgi:glutaconate CoA-transferase, subunit A
MSTLFVNDVDTLAQRIPDGASVSLNKGDEADVPMALAHALIRRGVRGLHVVTIPTCAYPASGMLLDLLIGAGCVASVETSGVSLHELGAAPCFSRAVKAGTLQVKDATCPAVYAGLQAGVKGQPFAPLRGLIGSDVQRHRSDYKIIPNPFATDPEQSPDPIVLVPAINADVAIFHAPLADRDGNVWIGRDRDRLNAAHAARTVLVTVDAVQEDSLLHDPVMSAGVIASFHIDGLCVAPNGCWPMASDGSIDLNAVRTYQAAAKTEEGLAHYIRSEVLHDAWCKSVGSAA